jgi:hypothetical protein
MISYDGEIAQLEWYDLIQEIVMVAPEIHHLRMRVGQTFHQQPEKSGVFLLPLARFAELPAVDDVSVENEFVATVMAEKMNHFPYAGVADTQVDIREHDCSEVRFQWIGVLQKYSGGITPMYRNGYVIVN